MILKRRVDTVTCKIRLPEQGRVRVKDKDSRIMERLKHKNGERCTTNSEPISPLNIEDVA